MAYDRLGEDTGAEGIKLPYHQQVLKLGSDEELTLFGYCRSSCKTFAFYLVTLITLGIPFLIVYWKPEWGVYMKRRRCSLMEADMLIIKVIYKFFILLLVSQLQVRGKISQTDGFFYFFMIYLFVFIILYKDM